MSKRKFDTISHLTEEKLVLVCVECREAETVAPQLPQGMVWELAARGWVLSVVDDGALAPVCPRCAERIYGADNLATALRLVTAKKGRRS